MDAVERSRPLCSVTRSGSFSEIHRRHESTAGSYGMPSLSSGSHQEIVKLPSLKGWACGARVGHYPEGAKQEKKSHRGIPCQSRRSASTRRSPPQKEDLCRRNPFCQRFISSLAGAVACQATPPCLIWDVTLAGLHFPLFRNLVFILQYNL